MPTWCNNFWCNNFYNNSILPRAAATSISWISVMHLNPRNVECQANKSQWMRVIFDAEGTNREE